MKFTAVGDVLVQKRLPENFYEGFEEIRDFIMQGDARFFNLETTLNYEGECFASQFSGGTYIRTNPEMYYDMLEYGFNMTTANNNHAFDYSYEGLQRTIETLDESDIVHAGLGQNLGEAAAPRYLETEKGRVALIAVNTSFNPAMRAGEQSKRVIGRPGVNGVGVTRKIMLPEEDFRTVQAIGEKTKINESKNITRKEGYYPELPEGVAELGDLLFVKGDSHKVIFEVNEKDLQRLKSSIKEAKMAADYVLVSVHNHQIWEEKKDTVPPFLEELMHTIIDAGADAVVGHGPHLLRAIEVYNEKPIFYSLGDFVIQLYDVAFAPEDFYASYGMKSESSVMELLEKRSAGFTRGLMEQDVMLETVIPFWETDKDNKLTSLRLMPVKASKGEGKHVEGLPKPVSNPEFINHLAELSKPYGVDIEMKDGIAVCHW